MSSMDCSSMVEHRVKSGSQALGAWMRAEVSGVNGRGEWQIFYLVDAVTGAVCIIVWSRDLGLPP